MNREGEQPFRGAALVAERAFVRWLRRKFMRLMRRATVQRPMIVTWQRLVRRARDARPGGHQELAHHWLARGGRLVRGGRGLSGEYTASGSGLNFAFAGIRRLVTR